MRLRVFSLFRFPWRCDALLFVDAKKQVIRESVLPPYMPSPQIKVHVSTGRQPHVFLLTMENNRAEFDIHMFREKLDLRHRGLQIGLDPDDLIGCLLDPSPAFQRDRGQRPCNLAAVPSQTAWFPGLLCKVNLPGTTSLPLSQSFATHLIIVPVVGMKNQNSRGKTSRGNGVREHGQVSCPVSVLLDAEIAGAHFRDRN